LKAPAKPPPRIEDAEVALFALDATRIRALHPDLLLTQALCDV
jgi:hypothetical protein